jgi:hypothetical protein
MARSGPRAGPGVFGRNAIAAERPFTNYRMEKQIASRLAKLNELDTQGATHEPQRCLELSDSAEKYWLRPPGSIRQKSPSMLKNSPQGF